MTDIVDRLRFRGRYAAESEKEAALRRYNDAMEAANLIEELTEARDEYAHRYMQRCGQLLQAHSRTTDLQCEPMEPDAEGWSEWIHPLPSYLMQCCDCGLVHEMEFVIGERRKCDRGPLNEGETEESVILFRARRATAIVDGSPTGARPERARRRSRESDGAARQSPNPSGL